MLLLAALWCLLVVLPVGYIFYKKILTLSLTKRFNSYNIGLLILMVIAFCVLVYGVVWQESPLMFYSGLGLVLALEGSWMIDELDEKKAELKPKLPYWWVICLVPTVMVLLS